MYYIIINPQSKFVSFSKTKHDICFGDTVPEIIKEYTNQQYADEFGSRIIDVPCNTASGDEMPKYNGIEKMTIREYMQRNCRIELTTPPAMDAKFIQALKTLKNAMCQVWENWPDDDGNIPAIVDTYPFDKSFDELTIDVSKWIETIQAPINPTIATTLYFVHDIDMGGNAIIMLYATDKAYHELSRGDEDECFIGMLTTEDADKMEGLGIDCSIEEKCIEYAKTVKGFAIPESYKLETIS